MVSLFYKKATLLLPSPELGDRDIYPLNIKIDRAMDGTIYTFNGPQLNEMSLTFRHVNRPKILEVITFLKEIAGNYFLYFDWNQNRYNVRYIEDTFVETHQGIHDNSFTLRFEIVSKAPYRPPPR